MRAIDSYLMCSRQPQRLTIARRHAILLEDVLVFSQRFPQPLTGCGKNLQKRPSAEFAVRTVKVRSRDIDKNVPCAILRNVANMRDEPTDFETLPETDEHDVHEDIEEDPLPLDCTY
ncbi:unnamed protein product [Cylicocyclus nassatus]|uniref:Uncharacterized protein n=1 Tax=Cylicocyclus nassatus TaxID=53992 RepID=A0AA36H0A2_CYLNA|nr:unnamed protein product [Cylicocyclus nassatus]